MNGNEVEELAEEIKNLSHSHEQDGYGISGNALYIAEHLISLGYSKRPSPHKGQRELDEGKKLIEDLEHVDHHRVRQFIEKFHPREIVLPSKKELPDYLNRYSTDYLVLSSYNKAIDDIRELNKLEKRGKG